MSDAIKVRAVWASVAIAALMLMLGGASFLLNARSLAAMPERVSHLENDTGDLKKRMDALEKDLQLGRKERLEFQSRVTGSLSSIEANQAAMFKTLDRLERKLP